MSQQKRKFEARSASVDEAIRAGLAALDLKKDEVTIEILDEGSRGLLGIGSRDAVVLLTALEPEFAEEEVEEVEVVEEPAPESEPEPGPELVEEVADEVEEEAETAVAPSSPPQPVEEEAVPVDYQYDDGSEEAVALEVVRAMFDRMGVETTVTLRTTDVDEKTGKITPVIDVRGSNLSPFIGQRGDTLSTIQYLARLIVANTRGTRAYFVIDIDGYRERREQALARLAERMAGKVIDRQHPISLEPMPPQDRRIIHITLREMDGVYTSSTGEGSRRKVQILPAK